MHEAPTERRRDALNELCRIYWLAIYSFARFRGHQRSEAEELTQGFFERLLDRKSFESLIPETGRLRSWLIRSFVNFRNNEYRKENAKRRGGGWIRVEIMGEVGEEWWESLRVEVGRGETNGDPAHFMDRIWALTVLEGALEEVGRAYESRGRSELFGALRPMVDLSEDEGEGYAEIALQLGMKVESVRKAVQRLRIAYAGAIRSQIEQTVDESGDIDEEFAVLRAALS